MSERLAISLGLIIAGLTLTIAGTVAAPQGNSKKETTQTVSQLCGKLLHAEDIPVKGRQNTFDHKTRALKGIKVQLLEWAESGDFCKGLRTVSEKRSGRGGRFEFKNVDPGRYWIVTTVGGHEYKMPLRYEKQEGDPVSCSDLFYEVKDSGEFGIAIAVTIY